MRNILVIEDNENNMYLMNFLLTKSGYGIIQARTGEDGVHAALREKPDMILMDILLPDIDGMEATRRIRQSSSDGDVPIVAVTSYAMTGDKAKVMAAGCSGYIEKPINPETFVGEIEKYFRTK